MIKKTLLYLGVVFTLFPFTKLRAGTDSLAWKRLIISEIKLVNLAPDFDYAYLELYNASEDTLDMMDYWIQSDWASVNKPLSEGEFKGVIGKMLKPDYTFPTAKDNLLPPGKTFLITTKGPNHWLDPWGNRVYPNDYYHPELWNKADRILDLNGKGGSMPLIYGVLTLSAKQRVALCYRGDTSTVEGVVARDSVMVDRFQNDDELGEAYVAGVITDNVGMDYIYARKTKYTKGEPDFEISSGTNADDSEWIVLPRSLMGNGSMHNKLYTTIGSHSNQNELAMTPNIEGISIDVENEVITFPYGIRRDSLFRYFDFGPEHAWDLRIGNDTAQWYVSTGDTIDIYVCGDELLKYEFHAKVLDMPTNFTKVRPAIIKNELNGNWDRRYTVSDGEIPFDTIGNVGYATPIDTLEKYLVIEEGAEKEYIFADGKNNIELKAGDKLKISAGGKHKTYVISVDKYAPQHNALLDAIYMPGLFIWENPETFEKTDTLIDFISAVVDYVVDLPEGTEVPPAIVPTAQSNRAQVNVARPKNLNGTDEARTAVITVKAEDDTTIKTYRILFNVKRETPPVVGEPFICDIAFNWKGDGDAINYQIFNPSDDPIDLSNYVMIVHEHNADNWNDFIAFDNQAGTSLFKNRENNKVINRRILRPSYWVNADLEGNCYYKIDGVFPNAELMSREVFSMAWLRGFPISDDYWKNIPGSRNTEEQRKFMDKLDMLCGSRGPADGSLNQTLNWGAGWYVGPRLNYRWTDAQDDPSLYPYGEDMFLFAHDDWDPATINGNTYLLYKIKNDSVADGTKPINKNFEQDHELVDVVNGPSQTGTRWTVFDKVNGVDSAYRFSKSGTGYRSACFARKPWVFSGNPKELASFGSEGHEGEWLVYGIDAEGGRAMRTIPGVTLGSCEYGQTRFENHTMITYAHIPYISSERYLISKGLSKQETIFGVPANTSVSVFMSNIVKPDTGMVVEVMDEGGNLITADDILGNGFKVKSTSANKMSEVEYVITLGALSSDVSLHAKSGSDITVDGTSIRKVPFGWTLKKLLSKLEPAPNATMLPTNGKEMIIPTEMYSNDSNMIQAHFKEDVLVSTNYKIEVSAQNGVDVAVYSISFADEKDVYVLSNIYKVYEEYKTLDFVHWTSVDAFMRNIVVSPGATATIMNKINQERKNGIIQFDDRLVVEKGNKKVVYVLKFVNSDKFQLPVKKLESFAVASVYPNPTKGQININGLNASDIIQVRTLTGQLIHTQMVNNSTQTITLKGEAGVYLVSVYTQTGELKASHEVIKY